MPAPALNILPSDQQRFGRYTLLCRFATGGMANLYLARFVGPDGFEKLVAIKRIHDHLSEEADFMKMFVDEARLAARISHPNVVQVIELGAVGRSHFIAMEYVEGESLTALIRRTQPPLRLCARIIANAAGGLHAAHQLRGRDGEPLNVVHRDVSPHNVLISYEGAVKVTDFGVARARGNLHTTSVGTVKGKFAYMAPEQVRLESLDGRADIFALGIVLYEISTRHRLFKAETEAATVTKVLQSEIVAPSLLVPDYPPALESIVMKALERDPDKRYPTAEALQEALEAFVVEAGGPLLQSALGQLMHEVFADRIKQKRELLRSWEQASGIVPEAEMGSSSTLTMGGATVSEARAQARALLRRSRRRAMAIISVLALFVAAAVGAGVYVMFPRLFPATQVAAVPKPAAPAAEKVTITISASPDTATIWVDGKKVGNPFKVVRPPSRDELVVKIEAKGFDTQVKRVSLQHSSEWGITLNRTATARVTPDAKDRDPPKATKTPRERVRRRRRHRRRHHRRRRRDRHTVKAKDPPTKAAPKGTTDVPKKTTKKKDDDPFKKNPFQ